jgi:hypothetical protein
MATRESDILSLQGNVAARESEIQARQNEIAARDARIANIYQSLSKKLTSPLQTVDHWLKIRH